MAIVRLVQGDLFDGPADMITLPCSTAGTVTPSVERRLQQFSLPHPGRMKLGQVAVCPLDDADQIAQYVAFAASVAAYSSTFDAIAQIGAALGKATRELPAVRSINAPLLGAGAGGLLPDFVVPRLREAFEQQAAPDAVLSIFVLEQSVYRSLASQFGGETVVASGPVELDGGMQPRSSAGIDSERRPVTSSAEVPPRVFISHTALPEPRKRWLVELYKYLRANGVNARIDAYSLRPGMDLVQWMCNELQQADRVLLICDERYADRADMRHGGVGWETMLIQGDLYASMYRETLSGDDAGTKYVPIVMTADVEQGRPNYLGTKLVLHWPPDADEAERRDALLRELFGVTGEPPIGPRPDFS